MKEGIQALNRKVLTLTGGRGWKSNLIENLNIGNWHFSSELKITNLFFY